MLDLAEPTLSVIKLTRGEREELARCELAIGETISAFLRCGAALSMIRRRRLFRETHATFERYVVERWALSKSGAETLLSSYSIAEGLQEAGIKLPAETTQSGVRPLAGLPREGGLRKAVWEYARSLSPSASCPPAGLLRKICRTVREALDSDVDGGGNRVYEEEESSREPRGRPEGNKGVRRDARFLRAVTRLAGYNGFSVPLIASQVQSERMAAYAWRSCERLKVRLDEVEQAILSQFPDARNQT